MDPILQLHDVTFERPGRSILKHIHWTIHPGEQWVVMGLNGSGKTSLLTIVLGYTWPTSGSVAVLGAPYGRVDLREHRKRIGWVSQHLAEWMTRDHGLVSVRELVSGGREALIGRIRTIEPANADVEAVLETFGLAHLATSAFALLSQGEKTRVLLARAWMAHVELLILDEPCSGLDLRHRESLLKLVNRCLESPTAPAVIYVTHHPEEILPGFTHALLLKDGAVMRQGPKTEMLTGDVLSELLQVPVTVDVVDGRPWIRVIAETPR